MREFCCATLVTFQLFKYLTFKPPSRGQPWFQVLPGPRDSNRTELGLQEHHSQSTAHIAGSLQTSAGEHLTLYG